MSILNKYIILNLILLAFGYSQICEIQKISFNEQILTYYLDAFDDDIEKSQINIFLYQIISNSDDCTDSITIEYTLKIYAPGIGFTSFENFFEGETEKDISIDPFFDNSDFNFDLGPTVIGNSQAEKLISYISQSGKLPNGYYLFQFVIKDDSGITLDTQLESIEIKRPVNIDLLYPGGELSELNTSYTITPLPLFTWYSDLCSQCTYGIRVCEFNKDKHSSLQAALEDWSVLPKNQSISYHEVSGNIYSFQYPSEGHIALEVDKYYVWQIQRTYETTLERHYDYSQMFVFEVRPVLEKKMDYTDQYLSLIKSLVGEEQFNLWFESGGELERFVTDSEYIWINGEKLHIDILYSLVSELDKGKIKINNFRIE